MYHLLSLMSSTTNMSLSNRGIKGYNYSKRNNFLGFQSLESQNNVVYVFGDCTIIDAVGTDCFL